MKKIQSFILLAIAVAATGVFSSCTKDNSDKPNKGVPRINYVRITNPLSSDSLLVGAYQNNLVAIVGDNLQDTRQVWFNDQPAVLTSTYISASSILVSTPAKIPSAVDNLLKLVFANGDTLKYPFKILINEPAVTSMVSEYVLTGDVATIRGDFFYQPLTVTFEGGAVGELVSVEDKIIRVKVPEGAVPGQVTVTTNFGSTKSNFWFRDNRNIILSSDPYAGWWNESYVVKTANTAAGDPPMINGNYMRVKKTIGAWAWTEIAGGPPDAVGAQSKNIPDEAILKPSDYNLKFELNTKKPYNNNLVKLTVGENSLDDVYEWKPPYDTKGEWQTITVPFEEVTASYAAKLAVNPAGYYFRLLFHGPGDLDTDMSFDNFRVVPKIIKK